MANTSGQCWPSLAQLGRKLGRSRASISAYIAELRGAGVLRTEEQKMANGYNYHLCYTVMFWKEWCAGLGQDRALPQKTEVKNTERRVQPTVRRLRTKNHIHKNQQQLVNSKDLVSEWKVAVSSAPYPEFTREPDLELLTKTESAVHDMKERRRPISADIEKCLIEFAAAKNIAGDMAELATEIAPLITSETHLTQVIDSLIDQWQLHWRNVPNTYQLTRIVKELPPLTDPQTKQKLLKSYLQRWKLHLWNLPSAALHSKVAA